MKSVLLCSEWKLAASRAGRTVRSLLLMAPFFFAGGNLHAGDSLSGAVVDARTLRIQEKVEKLFATGDYRRALFIYENELAPIGDKYAQYMLGYMYLTGAGVDKDYVLALAWYRLAAERGKTEFVGVRDELRAALSQTDVGRSDEIYRELRRRYSDVAVIFEQVEADIRVLTTQTGSRLPGGSRSLTVVNPTQRSARSGDNYYQQIRLRFEAGLSFLGDELAIPDLASEPEDVDLIELRAYVEAYLERVD